VPNVRCIAGPGIRTLTRLELPGKVPVSGQLEYNCHFVASLSPVGESFVIVEATSGTQIDRVRIALQADATISGRQGSRRSLADANMCLSWNPRSSRNVLVTVVTDSGDASMCPAASIRSEVKQDGDMWVFPAASTANGLTGYVGVVFVIDRVGNVDFPPRPLLLQLVEQGGGIWLVELIRTRVGEQETYSGLFTLAKQAPWKPDPDASLDLSKVREWMFGWGGYGGQKGQIHGFRMRSIELIHGDTKP